MERWHVALMWSASGCTCDTFNSFGIVCCVSSCWVLPTHSHVRIDTCSVNQRDKQTSADLFLEATPNLSLSVVTCFWPEQ